MEANGHDRVAEIKRAALAAADARAEQRVAPGLPGHSPSPIGTNVEIDPKKLGNEGHRLLGEASGLDRWSVMFAAFADKALDLREREVLRNVSRALADDAERVKTILAQFAHARGAAKLSPTDNPGEPLPPGWVLPDGVRASDYGRLPDGVRCKCANLIDTGSGLYCCRRGTDKV
jgi:hypothetical protein